MPFGGPDRHETQGCQIGYNQQHNVSRKSQKKRNYKGTSLNF